MSGRATTTAHGIGVDAVAWQIDERSARDPSEFGAAVPIAEEVPVGFVYNGFPYAVMMATPDDLEDFAVGFSLAEGLIADRDGIRTTSSHRTSNGIELAIELAPAAFAQFLRRRRLHSLRGHTSCGVCGIEDLAQLAVAEPDTRAPASRVRIDPGSITRAVAALREFQPLGRLTHCAHAAAWARPDGDLCIVREDVGRHNALDKLIGACLREKIATADGFCLVTSRCSYEMVQKAVAARYPALVAISAPTALAIRTARLGGLTLVALGHAGKPIAYGAAGGSGCAT